VPTAESGAVAIRDDRRAASADTNPQTGGCHDPLVVCDAVRLFGGRFGLERQANVPVGSQTEGINPRLRVTQIFGREHGVEARASSRPLDGREAGLADQMSCVSQPANACHASELPTTGRSN
jgi:hypothetical protein